jgi:hypothetical protein
MNHNPIRAGRFLWVSSSTEAKRAYDILLTNDRFIDGYIRSTADPENVKKRVEEARAAFGL